MYQVLNCLTTEHDWRLVVLGGAVCLLASAVAISLFHRAKSAWGRSRLIWIGMDAAVSGCGIWATHFIAMLAYDPGTAAGYNIAITLLSLVLAVAITAVGLAIAHWFAFRLAASAFRGDRVTGLDTKIGLAQVGAAIFVAAASSVPVLLFGDVREQEFTGLVPAVLIGIVGYLIARETGKSRVAAAFYGLTALAFGVLVALVKLVLAAH